MVEPGVFRFLLVGFLIEPHIWKPNINLGLIIEACIYLFCFIWWVILDDFENYLNGTQHYTKFE